MSECEHEIDQIGSADILKGYQVTTSHCKKCGLYRNQYRMAVNEIGFIVWKLDHASWGTEPDPAVAAFQAPPTQKDGEDG